MAKRFNGKWYELYEVINHYKTNPIPSHITSHIDSLKKNAYIRTVQTKYAIYVYGRPKTRIKEFDAYWNKYAPFQHNTGSDMSRIAFDRKYGRR